MTKSAVIFAAALSLTACTETQLQQQPPTTGWAKPGASYDDYLRDRSQCILAARIPTSDAYRIGVSPQAISAPIVGPCMNARGWVRDDANGFKPPPGEGVEMVR